MRRITVACGLLVTLPFFTGWQVAAAASGFDRYTWPVRGPVIRGFEAPANPFAAGHRGIDIAVPLGTPIRAPDRGVVTFAGWVAGSMFVTIEHPDGVRTSYSWLSAIRTSKGATVSRGAVVALTGHGHPEVSTPHLHFSARIGNTYIDPMLLLGGGSLVDLIHLAPLAGASTGGRPMAPAPPPAGVSSRSRWAGAVLRSARVASISRMAAPIDQGCESCSPSYDLIRRAVLGGRAPPVLTGGDDVPSPM